MISGEVCSLVATVNRMLVNLLRVWLVKINGLGRTQSEALFSSIL